MKKHTLIDSREIADYIQSCSTTEVDWELICEAYQDHEAKLQKIKVSDLILANEWNHIMDMEKQKRYNQMNIEDQPPIVIKDMKILDGNHRYRSARRKNAEYIWAYVIQLKD